MPRTICQHCNHDPDTLHHRVICKADHASRVADARLGHQADAQERADMRQDAAEAILRAMGRNYDDPAAAEFRAGYNGALKGWLDWRELRRVNIPADRPRTLFDDDIPAIPDDPPGGLTPDQEMQLADIFLNARQKRGRRGKDAAARDARIVVLLSRGYNNRGIAQELEVSVGYVKKARHDIRRILKRRSDNI